MPRMLGILDMHEVPLTGDTKEARSASFTVDGRSVVCASLNGRKIWRVPLGR